MPPVFLILRASKVSFGEHSGTDESDIISLRTPPQPISQVESSGNPLLEVGTKKS